jgi:hypothetical protein
LRKWLGLSAGLLAASGQAAWSAERPHERTIIATTRTPAACAASTPVQPAKSSPPRPAALLGRPVIAGSDASTVPESRPFAVSLEQPRVATSVARKIAYQEERTSSPALVVRAKGDVLPLPKPLPSGTPVQGDAGASFGGPMFANPNATPFAAEPMMPGSPALSWEGEAIDPDRYGTGDGVTRTFNNLFYIENEFLLYSVSGTRLPPLVTSGLGGIPGFTPTALATPTTQILFGNNQQDTGAQSGYRLRFGLWLDRDHSLGAEGSYFFLGQNSSTFTSTSLGMPFLGVPASTGTTEGAFLLAQPGVIGGATARLDTRLWGAEFNLRRNVLQGANWHVDVLAGFRAMGLDDSFNFATSTMPLGSLAITRVDNFATRNRFYGGQLGTYAEYRYGKWSFDITSKLALGNNNQRVEISGASMQGMTTVTGGTFAQSTNIGSYSRDKFALASETGLRVSYQWTDALRTTVGYNLLYVSNVVRPGEQIDRVFTNNRPSFDFKGTDFWAQGLTLGVEWRY